MGEPAVVKMTVMRKPRSDLGVPRLSDAEIIDRNSMPEPNSGCWLWTGNVNAWGYGRLGRQRSERQAHRLSYRTFKGAIPANLLVLHSCDVACCVNPDHLRLGTNVDNTQDAIARERRHPLRGAENPMAKLSMDAAKEIRSSSLSDSELAQQFGVSRRAIRFVREGKTWAV